MVWGHRYSVGWWLECYLRGRWSCVTTLSLFSSCLTGHFFPTWGLRPFLLVVTTRSAEQLDFIIAPGWWGTNSEERNTNNGRQLAWVTAYWGNISIKLMSANPQSNIIRYVSLIHWQTNIQILWLKWIYAIVIYGGWRDIKNLSISVWIRPFYLTIEERPLENEKWCELLDFLLNPVKLFCLSFKIFFW